MVLRQIQCTSCMFLTSSLYVLSRLSEHCSFPSLSSCLCDSILPLTPTWKLQAMVSATEVAQLEQKCWIEHGLKHIKETIFKDEFEQSPAAMVPICSHEFIQPTWLDTPFALRPKRPSPPGTRGLEIAEVLQLGRQSGGGVDGQG